MAELNNIQTQILNDLTESENGYQHLKSMVGAYSFLHTATDDNEPDNISFRFKGSRKANWVRITLNERDLYDVEFCKMHAFKSVDVAKFENAFNEDLRDIFEDVTGLYLKL